MNKQISLHKGYIVPFILLELSLIFNDKNKFSERTKFFYKWVLIFTDQVLQIWERLLNFFFSLLFLFVDLSPVRTISYNE